MEDLRHDSGTLWDTGKVSSDRSSNVAYAGKALSSNQQLYWKVRVWDGEGIATDYSAVANFSMGLLAQEDWQGEWIGAEPEVSSPLLRREFALEAPIRRATVHIAGLGYHELYVNGAKVGDHVLDPANTYYHNDQPFELGTRVLYVTHDVTSLLAPGENAVGVMLGHGWFSAEANVPPAPSGREPYGDRPKLLLQMIVEYEDGRRTTLYSDTSWQVHGGPILYNEYCNGETYDARLEQPGWTQPAFDAARLGTCEQGGAAKWQLGRSDYASSACGGNAASNRAHQPERRRLHF